MSEPALPRVTFSWSTEQCANLRALSVATGAPISELVRRAVAAYLEMRRTEWSGPVSDLTSIGDGGLPKHLAPRAKTSPDTA